MIDWSQIFATITGLADEAAEREVEAWRRRDVRNERLYRRAAGYYAGEPARNDVFTEKELAALFARLQRARRWRRLRQWGRRAGVAAAMAAVTLAAGIWLREAVRVPGAADGGLALAVGEAADTAVVVITAAGERRAVDDEIAGRLSYAGGEAVVAGDTLARGGQRMHTVVVPRGRTFELVLADGTFVVLSPLSELTYPVAFDSLAAREVTLHGEGYFEVAKSTRRFVVHTGRMKLQVYGTKFNVLAREGAADEAVLVAGSVGVTPVGSHAGEERRLLPGEKSVVDAAGQMTVEEADLAEYIAKGNGYILFNGKTVGEILRDMELYYDIRFVGDGMTDGGSKYVFSVRRGSPLREVLDALEPMAGVRLVLQGKEVRMAKR